MRIEIKDLTAFVVFATAIANMVDRIIKSVSERKKKNAPTEQPRIIIPSSKTVSQKSKWFSFRWYWFAVFISSGLGLCALVLIPGSQPVSRSDAAFLVLLGAMYLLADRNMREP